jgi:hypothetical protein
MKGEFEMYLSAPTGMITPRVRIEVENAIVK